MKFIYIFLIAVSLGTAAFAQTPRQVSGVVVDSTKNGIIGATVKLSAGSDSLRVSTKPDGSFSFSGVRFTGSFVITVTTLGYNRSLRKYSYNDGTEAIRLDTIVLKEENQLLSAVTITGVRAATIKEDTIEYKAADYKLPVNSVTEDLLKKVPGLEVDKDGNVTAQGKSVTRVKVNGKDFFGGDLQTATKNLPADLIERIQIVDDYGDQANLTGSRTGEAEKIINIMIRPDKNKGFYGNGSAGLGRDANNPVPGENRYLLSANANYFNNDRQLALLANLNNTNTNSFNFNGGGGNRGGGGFGGGGRGWNDGINSTGSIGFNYRDQWSKKLASYGSYSYSDRTSNVLSNTYQENYYQTGGNVISNQTNRYNNEGINHRFNWNFEYAADSLNFIKFSPSFSTSETIYGGNNIVLQSGNALQDKSDQRTISNSVTKTPNIGANLLLNHRFRKPGRNVSLNLSVNHGQTDARQYTDFTGRYADFATNLPSRADSVMNQHILTGNTSLNTTSRFLYIEPVGERSTLELNWNYSRSDYDNKRETFDLLQSGARVDSLSNLYNFTFTSNNFGLSYRFAEEKYNYSFGISGQPTVLNGESISTGAVSRRTAFNFVPVARFTYKPSRSKEINFNYYGRNNEPGYQQIQPVADRSNPNNPVIGNPQLNAEFQHSFNLRFNNSDFQTGRTLFTNFNYSVTNDKIVTNLVRVIKNKIPTLETHYLNSDGFYNMFGFYSYSIPMADRRYTLNLRGSARYNHNIAYSDNQENIGRNLVLSQRLRLLINPTPAFEVTPSFEFSRDANRNTLTTSRNSNTTIRTYNVGAEGKITFLKSMVVGFDYTKAMNEGYTVAVANPQILNAYLEKQFFKDRSGTLRIQGFDLFNENTGFTNTPGGNSLTQSRTNRLGRYFMLSFTMRLQKFAAGSIVPDNMQNNQDRRRDGMPRRF
jgi:hypothetical protein